MIYTYDMLINCPAHVLEVILREGVEPDPEKLVGYEFRGLNVSYFTKLLGFQKFKKGFLRERDKIWGYNVVVKQNDPYEPHIALPDERNPRRHGWFEVYPAKDDPKDNTYKNALLLNYGNPRNFLLNPARMLRDYLVKVEKGNDDLYLGKAYFALGSLRLPGSFFVLERYNKASFSSNL